MSVLGTTPISLRTVNATSHPTRGASYEAVFEGTEEAIQAEYLTQPASLTKRIDRSAAPLIRLYVSAGDDNSSTTSTEIITTFELLGNVKSLSIASHPSFLTLDPTLLQFTEILADDPKAETENSALTGNVPPFTKTYLASLDPRYMQYYTLWRLKQRDYYVSEYVFSVSQAISNRYAGTVGLANVLKVYGGSQLIAETSPPSGLFAPIDQVMASVDPGTTYTDRAFGWLKQAPRIQATGIKFQITNEWYLGLWPTVLYPIAS